MKNKILIFLLIISFNSFSQEEALEINFGVSLGTGISNQTLRTESNFNTSAGMVWNTIGGLPYRVDSYLGYNAGLILDIGFDLSSEQVDEKIIKRKISLKTGINYSSQGVIVEDVNMTRFENNLTYLQVPILLNFKIQKFNFFVGPQIHLLQDFSTVETRSSNLSSNATGQNPDFKFEKRYYLESDPNFVFGIGYEIYDGLSLQMKSLRSIKNITNISGEEWKNKSFELTANFILNSLL